MALVFNDRVKETSVTTGTGTLTLDGAVQGFETFSSAIGNSNTTYYAIELPGTTEFEVGRGTVSAGQLARTQVISSSNSDSPVDFSAGTKIVFCTLPASKAVIKDASGNIPIDANKTIEFGDSGETISGDGTAITVASSEDITLDAASEINLDAGSDSIRILDDGVQYGRIHRLSGGGLVLKSQESDKDIQFQGVDGGSGITALTLDMSEAGAATFNDKVILGANKVIEFGDAGETISGDGTDMTVASSGVLNLNSAAATGPAIKLASSAGGVLLDSASLIVLDADNADNGIQYKDGATEMLRIHNSSSDIILHTKVQDKDLIFKGNDGGSEITALTLDMSEAGAATFNDKIILGANKVIEFGDAGETISGDGTDLTIASSHDIILNADGDAGSGQILIRDGSEEFLRIIRSGSETYIRNPLQDKDIIFAGNDGGVTVEALKLDMSEAGAATFNDKIILGADKVIEFGDAGETIAGDGTDLIITSSAKVDMKLGSANPTVAFYSGGTQFGHVKRNSGNFDFRAAESNADITFRGNDGGTGITALSLDMSEAGAATFNDKVILGANKVIEFGDAGETISGDGTDLTITSSGKTIIDSTGDIELDAASGVIDFIGSGTVYGNVAIATNDLVIKSRISDGDMSFRGNDGGSEVTALTLDMSEAGAATFNSSVTVGANLDVSSGTIKLDGNYPTGTNNVALGNTALDSITSGNQNTAIGANALTAITTQSDSTAIGYNAASSTTGGNNTAIGSSALNANVSGTNNTVIGKSAARQATSNNNTAVGHEALDSQTGGYNNTAVGQSAGSTITSGNNLTVLGYNAEPSAATATNEITLGDANVTSLRIPGLASGASSGDVLTYDGTDITLSAPTGVSAGFAVAMAIAL